MDRHSPGPARMHESWPAKFWVGLAVLSCTAGSEVQEDYCIFEMCLNLTDIMFKPDICHS